MQFNPQTYKYEGEWNGQPVIVDSDVWSEALNEAARQNFGTDYADLDDAQTAIIDREHEDPSTWAWTDCNEAK